MEENSGANQGAVQGANENQAQNQGELKSFTESELSKLLLSEGDKRVEKALQSFKEKDLPALLENERQEAKRLALMSSEEKDAEEKRIFIEEYQNKLKALTQKELKIDAMKMLSERGLDVSLTEALNISDGKNLEKSIGIIEGILKKSIANGIDEKLKSFAPKVGGGMSKDIASEINSALGVR